MKQVDCLLSTSYAKNWIESFPIGNGHIGIMDNGNPHTSIITLNDDTLWSGYNADHDRDVSPEIWTDIRSAIDKHDFTRAEHLIHDNVLSEWDDTYLPLGSIVLDRALGIDSVQNYKRILDMSHGVQEISFNVDDMAYKRTSFVSHVDGVYTANITTSLADNVTISMTSLLAADFRLDEDNMTIEIFGKAPSHVDPIYATTKQPVVYDNTKDTIAYYGQLKIITNGNVSRVGDAFKIEGYTNIRLVYSSATNFKIKAPLDKYVGAIVSKASRMPFDKMMMTHSQDVFALYNRCAIELDYKSPDTIISTEQLMHKFENDDSYLEAVVCLFNLGRYLMISSSREGTEATNLQGIWSNSLRPPWCSNYTLNINTEMNYWGAELVNLSECHMPLVEFIKRLQAHGRETARRTFGIGGFTVAHNSDIWGHTAPVGGYNTNSSSCVYGFNISTAGWLCSHLFMHYEFTGDIQFLAETAYPIMLDAARFYLDYMTEDKETGYLVPSPSNSPENNFRAGLKFHSMCKASTMDIAVIKTLFKQILVASDILADNSPIVNEIETALPRILPYQISKKTGKLLEWNEDYKETDKHHRHISHMYALFPSNEITPTKEPALTEACAKSLKVRGNSGTGWSMAWKINASARLKDGNTSFELIKHQLNVVSANKEIGIRKGGSYKNMLCAHPPFQIDGNFGAMSGIAEMLIASHDNCIELLPALPDKWRNGSFRGLCARGGFVVNMSWRDGKVVQFEVLSNYKSDVSVRIQGKTTVYKTNKVNKL